MIIAILAALVQTTQATDNPAARLLKFIGSAHTLSAELTLSSSAVPGTGTVKIVYVRPNKLYYSMKWANMDYTFVGNERGTWNADGTAKMYDEFPNWGFSYPYSEVSSAPALFIPGYLMDGTLNSEQIVTLVPGGHATVNGAEVDKLQPASPEKKGELYVDHNGRPVRSVTYRNITITADVKSLVVNKPVADSVFGNNPPVGYKAYTVPLNTQPVRIGHRFPLGGWTPGGLSELVGQKETLVLVTSPGCEPSARSAKVLEHIRQARAVGVAVVSLSPSGGAPAAFAGFPKFFDPSGKMAEALNAPGTPLFYLLDKSGAVQKIWFGFDPDKAVAFEKDVLNSAK